MSAYTTNLELKIMESNNTLADVFTQGNYNANKLEEKLGGYLDDMETLPELRTHVTTLENSVSALLARTVSNENAINNVSSRVTKLENGRGYYIDSNGHRVDGTITRYEVNTTAVGSTEECTIPIDSEHRYLLKNARGSVNINLNTLLGITSMTGKKILNAVCYQTAYNVAVQVQSKFAFTGVYQPPTQSYYQLTFTAADLKITNQVYASATSTWSPQDPRTYQDLNVTVIFDLFEEIQE